MCVFLGVRFIGVFCSVFVVVFGEVLLFCLWGVFLGGCVVFWFLGGAFVLFSFFVCLFVRGFWGFFCSFFGVVFFLGGVFVVVFYVFSFKQSRTLMVRCRNFYLYNIAIYALRSNLSSLPLT